ncbi:MAG: hypothetical protein U0271_26910 [Polyangiaceae bacterium]
MALRGIFGRPFLDLRPALAARGVDLELGAIHEEVCLAYTSLPAGYTGGSHRSMGIMPEARRAEALTDYVEVITSMTDAEFDVFVSLADNPGAIDRAKRRELTWGEERAVPLSRRQMLWLKVRFGVYFPWKGYVELIPNERWTDKAVSRGKAFTRLAQTFFPKTIAFVKSLPFVSIGRCNVMGLEAHDYGTLHRDGEPEEQEEPDTFITFVPGRNKRLYLYDDAAQTELDVDADIYWFNDFDYHGVRADPFFRYSIRVDGVFEPSFLTELRRRARPRSPRPAKRRTKR